MTSQEAADQTVAKYEQRAEAAEHSPVPTFLKIGRVIVWIVYAIVLLTAINLTLAFFLRLFGASPEAAFVEWVYRNAEEAMRPFRGIFPTHELDGTSVLDTSLLFATIVYFIVALLVDVLLRWLTTRLQREERSVAQARADADLVAQQAAAQRYAAERAAHDAAAREYAAQQAAADQYAIAQAAAREVVAQQAAQSPPPSQAVRAKPSAPAPADDVDLPPPPPVA